METNNAIFRPYKETDLPRLLAITAEVFGPVSIDLNMENLLGPFGAGDWKSRKLAAIEQDCLVQPDGVFVVEINGRVEGYVTTRLNNSTSIGWIPNLAVAANFQGMGLGKALLEFAIGYLRASGMEVAKIETLEQNPIGQKLIIGKRNGLNLKIKLN